MPGSLVVQEGPYQGIVVDIGDDFERLVVGRSSEANLNLDDPLISRAHMSLYVRGGGLWVEDMDSANGTFVNGRRIHGPTLLRAGDTVRAGSVVFAYKIAASDKRGSFTGRKIGRYLVGELIGSGGMGEVYKTVQEGLGRPAAIKILSPELAADPEYVERFFREARSAGGLEHPHIIHIYDVGREQVEGVEGAGVYYYSMEFVDGGSVQDMISRGRALPQREAARIALETARALEYAESKGLVHCDVKPDNLMLTGDGRVKLADLGIAKKILHGSKTPQDPLGVFGSPHFMSPEQAMGKPLDHRSDIYSLGATLYRMLAGRTLFAGDDAREIMEKQVYEEPKDIQLLVADVHPLLAQTVKRMLAKRPEDRYQSAALVVNSLDKLLPELPTSLPQPSTVVLRRPRRPAAAAPQSRLPLLVVGGVLLAIGSAVVWGIFSGPDYLTDAELEGLLAEAEQMNRQDKPDEAMALLIASKPRLRPQQLPAFESTEAAVRKRQLFLAARAEMQRKLQGIEEQLAAAGELPALRALALAVESNEPAAASFQLAPVVDSLKTRIRGKAEQVARRQVTMARSRVAYLEAGWRFAEAVALWRNLPADVVMLSGLDAAAEAAAVEAMAAEVAAALKQEAAILAAQAAASTGDAVVNLLGKRSGAQYAPMRTPLAQPAATNEGDRAGFLADLAQVQEGMYRFAAAIVTRRLLAVELERRGEREAAGQALAAVEALNNRYAVFLSLVDAIKQTRLEKNDVMLPDGRTFKVVAADTEQLRLEGEAGRLSIAWGALPPEQFFELAANAPLTSNFCLEYARLAIDKGLGAYAVRLARKAAAQSLSLIEQAQELTRKSRDIAPDAGQAQERQLAALAKGMLFRLLDRGRLDEAWWYLDVLAYRFDRGIIADNEVAALRKDLETREKALQLRLDAAAQLEQSQNETGQHTREALKPALDYYLAIGEHAARGEMLLALGAYPEALKSVETALNEPALAEHPHLLLLKAAALAGCGDVESQMQSVRTLWQLEKHVERLPVSLARLAGRLDLYLHASDTPLAHLRLLEKTLKDAPLDAQAHERRFRFRSLYLPFPAEWLKAAEVAERLGAPVAAELTGEPLALAGAMLRGFAGATAESLLADGDQYLQFAGADALYLRSMLAKQPAPAEASAVLRQLQAAAPDFLYCVSGSIGRRLQGE